MGTMLSYFVIYSITDDKNKKLQKSYKAFTIFTIYSTIFYIQKRVCFIIKKRLCFKKETLAQVFCCEFCEIFKNTFFTEHFPVTASADTPLIYIQNI